MIWLLKTTKKGAGKIFAAGLPEALSIPAAPAHESR